MPASPSKLAAHLEAELRPLGDKTRAQNERAYLKSTLQHLGVTVPLTRKTALRALREAGELRRTELLHAVKQLWARRIHELRLAAVELLVARGDLLVAQDLPLIERLIREAGTWALIDPLAATVVGALVERLPQLQPTIDRWAQDDDFWIRRAALLSLLGPLRRGDGDFARFGHYADPMLEEREFFIRKAIGWVLRETSKKRPALVIEWLTPRAARASGVTLREALKYLPASAQQRIVQAATKQSVSRGSRDTTPGRGRKPSNAAH